MKLMNYAIVKCKQLSRAQMENTTEIGWQYVVAYHDKLLQICMRTAKYNTDLADELMHDVVYARIGRILELYDPAKGSLTNYVNYTIKRYAVKHVRKLQKQQHEAICIDDVKEQSYIENQDNRIEVFQILETLSEQERNLLLMHCALGKSLRELSQLLEIPRVHLSAQVKEIVERIRCEFPGTEDS